MVIISLIATYQEGGLLHNIIQQKASEICRGLLVGIIIQNFPTNVQMQIQLIVMQFIKIKENLTRKRVLYDTNKRNRDSKRH